MNIYINLTASYSSHFSRPVFIVSFAASTSSESG